MSKLESILNKARLPAFLISAGLVLALGLGCSGNQTRSNRGGLPGGTPGGMSGGLPGGSPGGMSRGYKSGGYPGTAESARLGKKLFQEWKRDPLIPLSIKRKRHEFSQGILGRLGDFKEFMKKYAGRAKPRNLLTFKEELETASARIDNNPNDVTAWFMRAYVYQMLDEHHKAISCYDRVISLDPDAVHSFYNRGLAYQRVGRLESAVENYRKAIALGFTIQTKKNILYCLKEIYAKKYSVATLYDFINAVDNRGTEVMTTNFECMKQDQLKLAVEMYANYNGFLKIGLGGIWMRSDGQVVSDGLATDSKFRPNIITLMHFYQKLGIDRTVDYFKTAFGNAFTDEEIRDFVKSHSDHVSGMRDLGKKFLFLSREECKKLGHDGMENLIRHKVKYPVIFARDFMPYEKKSD